MNRNKAILVTAIITGLLIIIDVGLIFLAPVASLIITGLFLLYGVFRSSRDFYLWLTKDEPKENIFFNDEGDF